MNGTRRVRRLVLAGCILAGPLAGQAAPCQDTVRDRLGALVGHWDARTVFRAGTGWDTTRATVTVERDLDGCLLREMLVGTRDGRPFHVLSLWGAAGLHAPIQRTSTHSQHGLITVSGGDLVGGAMVLRDSQTVRAALVHFEQRFEPFGADSMRFTSRRSTDGGGTWVVTWFADYRRTRRP